MSATHHQAAEEVGSILSQRALRNHSSDVLRRVQSGESFTITVHGSAVARIVPLTDPEPRLPISKEALRRGRFTVPAPYSAEGDRA